MTFDLSGGTFFDEDLQIDITHSSSPVPNTWQQTLQGPSRLPVHYRLNGGWDKYTATNYTVAFNPTTGYALYDPTGTGPVAIDNNRYGISWIVATNGLNEPVISIMGQQAYVNIGDAVNAKWGDPAAISLSGLPIYELRPLYKVIFQSLHSGSVVKAAIRQIDDLRVGVESVTAVTAGAGTQQTINVVAADHIVTTGDVGELLRCTNTVGITITVNDATSLLEGQRVDILRNGTGTVTVSPSGLVSLEGTPGRNLRAQYSAASIVCVAPNTYVLIGDLAV
jgi:hypothetical protein